MSRIIKLVGGVPRIVDDQWQVWRGAPDEVDEAVNAARTIFPLSGIAAGAAGQARAVWIAPEDDFEPLVPQLLALELIAVDFPVFRDGRGYSIATLLRVRHGWTGELRAVGDVLRDQLNFMRRCGFDAFAVRADKDVRDAIKSFAHYSVAYQGAVDQPAPLFRRRGGSAQR